MGCKGMTVTYDSTAMPVSALELNLNQTVTRVRTVNGSGTVAKVLLNKAGDARVTGSFDLQDTDAAFELVRDAMAGDTDAALAVSVGNGTDTIALAAPKVQIMPYSYGSNDNIQTYSVPFALVGDFTDLAGDNDFTLAYT